MKLNCWEYRKCGREPGGENTSEFGVCPASTEGRLNGVHGGVSAGRACWVVGGTICDGNPHGTFAKKINDCKQCKFYIFVREEEGSNFIAVRDLLGIMYLPGSM
jgi:hypothetical protein